MADTLRPLSTKLSNITLSHKGRFELQRIIMGIASNVKAVAVDYDGTLRDEYGEIPLENINLLVKLMELKIHVLIISGQGLEELNDIMKCIKESSYATGEDLKYLHIYANNGGCGYPGLELTTKPYYEKTIERNAREALIPLFKNRGWDTNPNLETNITDFRGHVRMIRPTTEGIAALYEEICKYLGDRYDVTVTKTSIAVEINPKGVGKHIALTDAKERLGLENHEIVKIGDQGQSGGNDEGLLREISSFTVDRCDERNPNQIWVSELLAFKGKRATTDLLTMLIDILILNDQLDQLLSLASKEGLLTKVIFGVDSLDKLGEVCSGYGKSALVVTEEWASKSGLAGRCADILRNAGISVVGYHDVKPNPTVHQVNKIVKIAKDNSVNMLVAVGGGSVTDAAKAASVIIKEGGAAEQYLEGELLVSSEAESVPVIAVPTTAGTGAELSKGAIISWPERSLKGGIRGKALIPKIALVDPILTLTMSPDQTRITGFDVFTHAAETYVSKKSNPTTEQLSTNAIKAVCRFLPRALKNPEDLLARTYLSMYSMLMGYNLANSSTCLPHRLQYPIGAATDTAHALGLAALYPAWLTVTYQSSKERFQFISECMAEGMDIENKGIFVSLYKFMQAISLSPTLHDLGINDADTCIALANKVSGSLVDDPGYKAGMDLSSIYKLALEPMYTLVEGERSPHPEEQGSVDSKNAIKPKTRHSAIISIMTSA